MGKSQVQTNATRIEVSHCPADVKPSITVDADVRPASEPEGGDADEAEEPP